MSLDGLAVSRSARPSRLISTKNRRCTSKE
jgi:hypothetical protein